MAGIITIDTVDVKTYGVMAVRGSYNDLVAMPTLKDVSSYSWQNENYEDQDLRNRKIAARDVSLTFLLSGSSVADMFSKRDALFTVLKADGTRALYIASLDKTFTVYYKSCESAQFIKGPKYRIKMVLKFRLISS